MKRIKSYTSIWNVEKVLYSLNDIQLPFPITYTQIAWLVASLMTVILCSELPPLCFIESAVLRYVGIPVGITWFMSQKAFDGKKPYGFLKSAVAYFLRPKRTYAGKKVTFRKAKVNEYITIVRSEEYVPNQIY